MDHAAEGEGLSVESEFADTVRYLDLYLRQKTDLFLQDYVFEPVQLLSEKFVELAVLITLLVAGIIVLVTGAVFLMTTVIALWAALLITAAVLFIVAALIAHELFSKRIVLRTPVAEEVADRADA